MPGKSKKTTVPLATLNALDNNAFHSVDLTLDYSTVAANGDLRPQVLRFNNVSGGEYGYVIISNQFEVKEQVVHPEWYQPIPIETGISDLNVATNAQFLYIFQLDKSVVATADFVIYTTNFIAGLN